MPEIAVRVAPSPGSVQPGNLYVDLQTRTLWLGVTATVDPDRAQLISDIDGTLQLIAEVLQDAYAFTNQQVAPKANIADPVFTGNPQAPTPTTADNDQSIATTAFVKNALAALAGTQYVPGMVMLWGGISGDIGVAELANWGLCDGHAVSRTDYPVLWQKLGTLHGAGNGSTTFNLPDLTERFVMGAGLRSPGLKNEASSTTVADTNVTGSHGHDITGTVLLQSQLPGHTHGVGTLDGTGTGYTDSQDAINHNPDTHTGTSLSGARIAAGGPTSAGKAPIPNTPAHSHTVTVTDLVITGVTGPQSGTLNQAHDHDTIDNGAHSHTVSALELREALPFYTLCYIIRLK